jgi:glutathione S-transferase
MLGDMGGWARAGRFTIDSDAVNAYLDRVLERPARARAQANGGAFA